MTWWVKFYLADLKRVFSYRVEFWVGLMGNVASQFAVAYFVWRSIFHSQGVTSLQGFTFNALMAYYLLAPMVERTVQGSDWGHISRDIYEGGLNRYLVYPISFFGTKFISQLAQSTLGWVQLMIVWVVVNASGVTGVVFDPIQSLAALGVMACAILVQFAIHACLEQMAFWADNVWSLLVMSRMIVHLAGGALLPLTFFPQSLQTVFHYLPFRCFIDLPTRLLLGQSSMEEALTGMALALTWTLFLAVCANGLWRRGMLRYSGAGM
jgi:ABC-2 type transport system permease protein